MSDSADEKKKKKKKLMIIMADDQKPLLSSSSLSSSSPASSKGGFKTLPFILGSYGIAGMVGTALSANTIVYLMNEYHMDMAYGTNLVYFWNALSNSTPVIGAFMADSLLGRFQMIGIGYVVALVGMLLIWLSNVIELAKPPPCYSDSCSSATTSQLVLLCASFSLFSIGTGGVTSSSLAFGADQLVQFHNNASKMESYFSWFYAIATISSIVGITGLVYIQENFGWEIGYGVLVALLLLAALAFFLGSALYLRPNPKKGLITGFFQVALASFRNRNLKFSSGNADLAYHSKGSILSRPSEKLRCLNKACVIQDPERDLNPDGTSIDPWRLCTVDQVEELKALVKVIPIWFTRMIMSINTCQGSFAVLQAKTLDRHIGPNFEIPAGSVSFLATVSVIIWIILYDRVILPIATRIRGKTCHFTMKSRMGCGIFVSFLAMATTAIVECIRRAVAIHEGHSGDADASINMSILWVVPPYALLGLAEGLNAIAINEFYISEFPKSMSSIASSLYVLGVAFASLVSSLLMNVINDLTRGDGDESWISSNVNKGHYDYFYWVLAGLSIANFLLFLVFSKAYGPFKDQITEEEEVDDDIL